MIIVYFLDSKRIINFRVGNPAITEVDGKYYSDGEILTNAIENIGIKSIAEQDLERDIGGVCVHDADHYPELTPQPTAEERLAAVEQYLLEQELGL